MDDLKTVKILKFHAEKCKGCVHENGHDPNYMGNCENCIRNPNYVDFYTNKEEFEKDIKETEQ